MAAISQGPLDQRLSQDAIHFLEAREKGYTSDEEIETRPLFGKNEYIQRGLVPDHRQPLYKNVARIWTESELTILLDLVLESRLSRFGDSPIDIEGMIEQELGSTEASRLPGDEENAAQRATRVQKIYSMVDELISIGKVERQLDGTLRFPGAHSDNCAPPSSTSTDDGSLPDALKPQPIRTITPEPPWLTAASGAADTFSDEPEKHEQSDETQHEQGASVRWTFIESITRKAPPSLSIDLSRLANSMEEEDDDEETTTMTECKVINGKGNEAFDASFNTLRITNAESFITMLDTADNGEAVSTATNEVIELSQKDRGDEDNVPDSVSVQAEEDLDTAKEPQTQAQKKARKRRRPKKKGKGGDAEVKLVEGKAELILCKFRITKESSVEDALDAQTKLRSFVQDFNITSDRYLALIAYHQNLCIILRDFAQVKIDDFTTKASFTVRDWRYHFVETVWTIFTFVHRLNIKPIERLEAIALPAELQTVKDDLTALLTRIRTQPPWTEYIILEAAKLRLSPLVWCLLCHRAHPVLEGFRYRQLSRLKDYSLENIPLSLTDSWEKLTRYTLDSDCCGRILDNFPAKGDNPHINAPKEEILSLLTFEAIRKDFDLSRSPDISHENRIHLDQYLAILSIQAKSDFDCDPAELFERVVDIIGQYRALPPRSFSLPLPFLPEGWSGEKDFKAIGSLTAATQRSIEPVGPHFLAHARRARHKRTFSEDDRIQAQENVKKVEDDDSGEISEPEDPMMLSRDAKDWKTQDHYAVLGLSKYRIKASEEQIKRAHRKKVLRHHPDKKAAAGSTEDDSFFKCIQKATEILLDPVKRRQYDSVDEHADVEPPTKKQLKEGKFYKLWGNVFKAEGRFSREQPVPKFGDEKSTQEEVENFYNFFYNFDSWRSFEYQDEDVPDDNENRDQKRHMERKNNNARKKKKNEDVARLRKLVDDAMAGDERIKKFRQAANANKNKKRLEKEAAEKKAQDDAKAAKEAEAKAAKEAEEKAKVDKEQGKKAKEAAKAAVKKNRRVLKGSVKDANYFVSGEAPASAIDSVLNDVELVQGKLDPDETAALAGKLNGLKIADEIKSVWSGEVKRLVEAGKIKDGEVKALA